MTKVMLIAGVAALAIAAPAAAGPHGGHGGGHGDRQQAAHGGGRPAAQQQRGGGGRAFAMQRQQNHGGGFRMQASRPAPRMQRAPEQRMRVAQRAQAHGHGNAQHGQQMQRQAMQRQQNDRRQAMQRQAMQHQRNDQRQAMKRQLNDRREAMQRQHNDQRQARAFQQQRERQARVMQQRDRQQQQARNFQRQQVRGDRDQQRQRFGDNRVARMEQTQQMRQMQQFRRDRDNDRARIVARQFANNDFVRSYANVRNRAYFNGCPSGLASRSGRCVSPVEAMGFLGAPVSRVASFAPLAIVPQPLQYLYPDTPNYYYRYGDGYMYQVDRSSNLINSLLPLIGGGYLPGMTFPTSYMNSYVPNYYGYDSFYADTPYVDYRYMDGNVYGVDPYSGMIQDVIPTYGNGYGVGQMLPAGYGYYNVPSQYRSVYYNTPDYNYWYAPGAIYQVDPNTQLITSVASLLAPGMSVGQPLPMGYGTYNVPMAYRATYYDTPNAWYRYNNGNIYQVDPTTQIVTAIVASLLT